MTVTPLWGQSIACASGDVSAVACACYRTFAPASPAVCGQGTEAANDRPFGDIERAPLESFSTAGTDIQALFRSLHSADDQSG